MSVEVGLGLIVVAPIMFLPAALIWYLNTKNEE